MLDFHWTTWLLVFLRASAMLAVFPLFTMPQVPVRVRVALGALFAVLIAPGIAAPAALPATFIGLLGWMILEVLVGLLLGFVTRVVFYLFEFAGNVIAAELGMNWGAAMNPFSNARSEAPALALFYLGAMMFFALDLHHWLLAAFQQAYQVAPIGGARLRPALFEDMVHRTGQLFHIALLMSAPVIAVVFLINLVFSLLARAVPQMNVFAESFSFRALVGMGVFGLTLNLMAQHAATYLRRLPGDMVRVAQLLGGG